jgi:hypothetical protein
MRRLYKFCLFLAMVCLVGVAGLFLAWRGHVAEAQEMLEQALAETEQADPGWRLNPVDAPSDGTAVSSRPTDLDCLCSAAAAMPKQPWPFWSFPQFAGDLAIAQAARRAMNDSLGGSGWRNLLNPEQARVIRAELDRAHASLEFLHKLPLVPKEKLTPESVAWKVLRSEAHLLISMLEYEARWLAHEGKMHEAMIDIQIAWAMGQMTREAPNLFMQIRWRGVFSHRVVGMVRQVLALGEASEADLAILQQELSEEATHHRLLTGLRGERARIDSLLERLQSGDLSVGAVCAELGHSELIMFPNGLETQQRIRLYLDVCQERADFLRDCLPIVELARAEIAERQEQILSQGRSPLWGLTAAARSTAVLAVNPAIAGYLTDDSRSMVDLQAGICSVAAERFRLKHGHWPGELDELVPQFLPEIPAVLKTAKYAHPVRSDGNFYGESMFLYETKQRRQTAKPWTFSPDQVQRLKGPK